MCDCASCEATNKVEGWPKPDGEVQQFKRRAALDWLPPAQYPLAKLERMDRSYKAHVAHGLRGGINRLIPPSAFNNPGAGFYGVPAGSTLAIQAEVLRRTFRQPSPFARLAQQYRQQRETA